MGSGTFLIATLIIAAAFKDERMTYLRDKAQQEKPDSTTNNPDHQADMGANEVESWLRNRVAPVITESQLRGFLMHASDLERMRIEHQLEALRN